MSRSKKITADRLLPLTYFTNYILRNIVLAQTVGYIHDGEGSLRSWINQNRFKVIFDLSSHQLRNFDLSSLSDIKPDVVICDDPFNGMDLAEIKSLLPVLDLAREAVIITFSIDVYSFKEWHRIFSELGLTVQIYNCSHYMLVLSVKNEYSSDR